MRRRWIRLCIFIWMVGLCPIFLIGGMFGVTDIGALFLFWLFPALAAGLAWSAVGFVLGIRQGYAEGEREYRRRTNRCLHCGYSLRGNVGEVCPECGCPIPCSGEVGRGTLLLSGGLALGKSRSVPLPRGESQTAQIERLTDRMPVVGAIIVWEKYGSYWPPPTNADDHR